MPDLSTSIGSFSMERPAMLASGILGISPDVFRRVVSAGAGAVVTKSVSREPWEGYPNPTVVGTGSGGWINAVGLSNPGAEDFAQTLSGCTDVPTVVSLVGSEPGDFEFMIGRFDGCRPDAFELNLSCPHVARVGLEVGDDPELVRRIVRAAKASTDAPVIAKVGLGTTHYLRTVGAAITAGADAVTAINTIRAMAIDVEVRRPVLSNRFGGLSGSPIRPVAVRCVYEISSEYDIPVIGCGGISGWRDAVEFILAGASAVQIGSAVGDGTGIFGDVNDGIEQYMAENGYAKISEMVGLAKGS